MRELTQEQLAQRLGTQQATICKIERRDDPSVRTLRYFVEALGGELRITVRLLGRCIEYCLGDDEPPSSR